MKRNQINITSHFLLSEFEDKATGLVRLHPLLPIRLERLRTTVEQPLIITSSCRTWPEHRRIYCELYGPDWPMKISLKSQHLLSGPNLADLSEQPMLRQRFDGTESHFDEGYRSCCAADLRLPAGIPLNEFAKTAKHLFDFVKIYSWGIHVDLRHTFIE